VSTAGPAAGAAVVAWTALPAATGTVTGFDAAAILTGDVGFLAPSASFFATGDFLLRATLFDCFALAAASFRDAWLGVALVVLVLGGAILPGFAGAAEVTDGEPAMLCAIVGAAPKSSNSPAILPLRRPRQAPRIIQFSDRRGHAPAVSWPDRQ
jgi:hypothetical protein